MQQPSLTAACLDATPAGSKALRIRDAGALVGRYALTLIQTAGDPKLTTGTGELVLFPNDSTRRYGFIRPQLGRARGERPVRGYYDLPGAPSYDERRSRDSTYPGVELIDSTLYLGSADGTDGAGERLSIEAVTPQGFWGHWRFDPGIEYMPDRPRGHFCAVRQPEG